MVNDNKIVDERIQQRIPMVMKIAEQLNYLDCTYVGDIGDILYDMNRLCANILKLHPLSLDCLETVFKQHYRELEKIISKGDMGEVVFGYNDGHIDTANVVRVFVTFENSIDIPLKYGDGKKFVGEISGECFFECILDCNELVDVFENGDYVGTLDFKRCSI